MLASQDRCHLRNVKVEGEGNIRVAEVDDRQSQHSQTLWQWRGFTLGWTSSPAL